MTVVSSRRRWLASLRPALRRPTYTPLAAAAAARPRPVILFDGLCGLCNLFVRFCAARDGGDVFTFAPLGSAAGRALIRRHGLFAGGTRAPDSFVVVEEDGQAHVKSDAALRALSRLQHPAWILMMMFAPVPAPLRDLVYDLGWRYRTLVFGVQDRCSKLPAHRRAQVREKKPMTSR